VFVSDVDSPPDSDGEEGVSGPVEVELVVLVVVEVGLPGDEEDGRTGTPRGDLSRLAPILL